MSDAEKPGSNEHEPNGEEDKGGKPWTRTQVGAFWFAAICIVLFLILVGASAGSDPTRSERYISLGLIVFSASFAAVAYAFLGRQAAKLRFKAFGAAVSISGAVAAFIIIYGSLQFFVRGTSTLYVALFSDDAFARPWRAPSGQPAPEFSASLRDYSIIAYPEGSKISA